MRVGRSRFGWILVAIYLVTFVVAYLNATAKRGTFLYDIWLDILTLPYIVIVGRLFLQSPVAAQGHLAGSAGVSPPPPVPFSTSKRLSITTTFPFGRVA
jgi:hypothetical protein